MMSGKAIFDEQTSTRTGDRLLKGCVICLDQCEQLLDIIATEDYCHSDPGAASVGAHIRHILDRYQCFLTGRGVGHINYDDRKRDHTIEINLESARFSLNGLRRRLRENGLAADDHPILVSETVDLEAPPVTVPSTPAREMMALISHSIHHLAIIAVLMKARGYHLSPDIGKAPSTLVYERG